MAVVVAHMCSSFSSDADKRHDWTNFAENILRSYREIVLEGVEGEIAGADYVGDFLSRSGARKPKLAIAMKSGDIYAVDVDALEERIVAAIMRGSDSDFCEKNEPIYEFVQWVNLKDKRNNKVIVLRSFFNKLETL